MKRTVTRLSNQDVKSLLSLKVRYGRRVAFLKTIKVGFLGLLGIFLGQVVKSTFSDQAFTTQDYVCMLCAFNALVGYSVFDYFEAKYSSIRELVMDLISLRTSGYKL